MPFGGGLDRSGGGGGSNAATPLKIRDHMDDILEARGYYRKHTAHDQRSVFRAVADALFRSQQRHSDMLRYCLNVYRSHGRKKRRYKDHQDLRDLVDMLGVSVDLLETSDPDICTLRVSPRTVNNDDDQEDSDDDEVEAPTKTPLLASKECTPVSYRNNCDDDSGSSPRILLCFCGPNQYDPVYPKSSVDTAGVVQSILYELLYVDVFGMKDAMQAAELMLGSDWDPIMGKPEVYDRDFQGTAMEALSHYYIPFPYKVAKALDPDTYRYLSYLYEN